MELNGATVLVTGGTGSLGQVLVRRLLQGEMGTPGRVIVYSRDEAKQHQMRLSYMNRETATDEVIFQRASAALEFRIGDVRDYHAVAAVVGQADVVFNAAALKQVPTCEYVPFEAVRTNIEGPENIIRAISEVRNDVIVVVGVSTDKACKPVNVMGMTKALQERLFISANLRGPKTRFICVRYGNVLASRGSVIPLFLDQIRAGGPVTLTTRDMTRFLLSLDEAVDTIFAALSGARRGETYVPRVQSARVEDVATALIGGKAIEITETGIRPGEKIHEILVSDEEAHRTVARGGYLVIRPILPELQEGTSEPGLKGEFSSALNCMTTENCRAKLDAFGLIGNDRLGIGSELLR